MSQINFENLRREYPQFGAAWDGLQDWLRRYPTKPFIDPRLVIRDAKGIPIDALTFALIKLVESGALRRVFKVESPFDHRLLDRDFDSRRDIPSRLHDYRDREFCAADANVVQVFRHA